MRTGLRALELWARSWRAESKRCLAEGKCPGVPANPKSKAQKDLLTCHEVAAAAEANYREAVATCAEKSDNPYRPGGGGRSA